MYIGNLNTFGAIENSLKILNNTNLKTTVNNILTRDNRYLLFPLNY